MDGRAQVLLWEVALVALVLYCLSPRGPLARLVKGLSRRDRWLLVGVVGLAAGLRLVGSLWSIAHENAHGYDAFEFAVSPQGEGARGLGGMALYSLAVFVGGATPYAILALNFVLSSLAAGFAFLAAGTWFRSSASGVLAGLLVATNPVLIRVSATEILMVPELCLTLLTVALLVEYLHNNAASPIPVALAAAFATQCRPLGLLQVLPLGLLCLVHWRKLRGRRPAKMVFAGLLLALPLALRVVDLLSTVLRDGAPAYAPSALLTLSRMVDPLSNPFVDLASTPVLAWLCVVVGVVVLVRRRPLALIPLLAGLLVVGAIHAGYGQNVVDRIRHHVPALTWFLLLGGAAASGLQPACRPGDRWRRAAWAPILVLAAAGLLQCWTVMTQRFDTQREYDFLDRAMTSIPPGASLVRLEAPLGDGHISASLPEAWLRKKGGVRDFVSAREWLAKPGAGPAVWYLGLACWVYDRDELERLAEHLPAGAEVGMRPECRRMMETTGMRPLSVRRFAAQPDSVAAGSSHTTLGLYLLPGRPSP